MCTHTHTWILLILVSIAMIALTWDYVNETCSVLWFMKLDFLLFCKSFTCSLLHALLSMNVYAERSVCVSVPLSVY